MGEQFSEKAGKLLDRINSISLQQRKAKFPDPIIPLKPESPKLSLNYQNLSMMGSSSTSTGVSAQTLTLLQLTKIEQDLSQNQEQNCRKFKNLSEQIRKLEGFIRDENQARVKIHESFVHALVKAEKNMQASINNIKKIYHDRQKKLQQKIQQVLKQEKKQILQQIQSNISIQQNLNKIKQIILSLRQQIADMRKTRLELQDKISRQFNDQIFDLKKVFTNSIKIREQKQLKILQMLKNVYKKYMQNIRKQQLERESSQKMFLTVIQQLIDRITQA